MGLEFETKKIGKNCALEFGTKKFHENDWVKESEPEVRTSHRWVLNSRRRKVLTQITSLRSKLHSHFFYSTHPLISQDEKVLILCHKWDPPHSWKYFWYHDLRHGFSTRDSTKIDSLKIKDVGLKDRQETWLKYTPCEARM